jgi:hypothetical protein
MALKFARTSNGISSPSHVRFFGVASVGDTSPDVPDANLDAPLILGEVIVGKLLFGGL